MAGDVSVEYYRDILNLDTPLNQVKASDVDDASKYKIALLSTRRRTAAVSTTSHELEARPRTVTVNNASRLR